MIKFYYVCGGEKVIDITKIKIYMLVRNINLTLLANKLNKLKSTLHRWFVQGNMPVKYAGEIVKILNIPKEELEEIFFKLQ